MHQEKKEAEQSSKEIRKEINRIRERNDYAESKGALLKMADDLANGNFRAGGATKKELYLFAMVFHMSYYCENSQNIINETLMDYDSDIEKNLFQDYYTNNLMRFMSDVYEEKANTFELDPSGQGINYKNFAEMIYIYFISKSRKELSAEQKIEKSAEMIARLKDSVPPEKQRETGTQYYRNLFTEEILKLSENSFEQFIMQNYDCKTSFQYVNKQNQICTGSISAMQVQNAQNTAFEVYQGLIGKIQEECLEAEISLKDCSYGLWFEDISLEKEKLFKKIKKALAVKSAEQDEKIKKFVNLLCGMHYFIGQKSSDGLIKALHVQKPELMTRTAMIVAYYYWYNLHDENQKIIFTDEPAKSFLDVYYDYTDMQYSDSLNYYLKQAGYQLINDKNIFDITIIFSSYDFINH